MGYFSPKSTKLCSLRMKHLHCRVLDNTML